MVPYHTWVAMIVSYLFTIWSTTSSALVSVPHSSHKTQIEPIIQAFTMKSSLRGFSVVALVWMGLFLPHASVAFSPFSPSSKGLYSTPSTSRTPKAASLTVAPDEVSSIRKSRNFGMNIRPANRRRHHNQGKFRVRYAKSMTQKNKVPIFDVEPPLTNSKRKTELVNAIGMKPSEMRPWKSLDQGASVSGEVIKVLPYGYLIQTKYDIPSKKSLGVALLHHRNVPECMQDSLTVGSSIDNGRVANVNRRQGTVSLSLKPTRCQVAPDLAIGEEVDAKVVKILPYGAFLDIGHPQRQALLHVSRMSVYKVHDITDHVEFGQTLKARIIHLSDNDIGVSILSKENDAFLDRRQLQSKRMDLWRQVVRGDTDEEKSAKAKQELLEVDAQLWELLSDYMDTPRASEV